MKYLFLILLLLANYSFAQEGVSTDIDPKRLNEVMDWVNNAKFELDIGTENISKFPVQDQERSSYDLITRVLQASGTRSNEFLMRNLLYRTQVIYNSVQNVTPSPKRDAFARRILEEGINWSVKLYQADKSLLEQLKSKSIPDYVRGVSFVNLGLDWADYMFGLYYAVPDNKTKLKIMRDLMGLFYNDINNDDSVKRILAPISGNIASKNAELKNTLQNNPPKTPMEELALARDLRRFIEQHITIARKLLSSYPTNIANNQSTATTSLKVPTAPKNAPGGLVYEDYRRAVKPGEQVWTTGGYTVVVNAIFPNGEISVRSGSSNYKFSRSDLAIPACYKNLCPQDNVISKAGYSGKILGAYLDGSFAVRSGSAVYKFDYESLAKLQP